jgi:hypothetical protein
MTTENTSKISRRSMLRTSGALVAGGAVLAACGTEHHSVARIGQTPEIEKLPDVKVTDAALLRTAMSVEKMVADMLSDKRMTSLADAKAQPIVSAFAAAHLADLAALSPMVTARNAEPVNEANKKLMSSYGENALRLVEEGKNPTDVLALTHALESLVAATYQYFVSLTTEPALRGEMMRMGAKSARRAAVAAQMFNGGIKALSDQLNEDGTVVAGTIATFPSAFGPLNAVQVALGPEIPEAPRANVLMDTPSLNSILY